MKFCYWFLSLFLIVITPNINAQTTENLSFNGSARFAYLGSGSEAGDIFNGTSFLRFRLGSSYSINENSTVIAGLAVTQNDQFPALGFTIQPDGGGVDQGNISLDNIYYQYKDDGIGIKIGRFQHTPNVKSNAGRSILRYQSNNVNNHWVDGFQVRKALNEDWTAELVTEYQNRGNTSYSYSPLLNFGNNKHNVAAYLGAENLTRDDNNFIQKNFAVFIAPDAFLKPDGYSTYFAIMSQLAHDTPIEYLKGGSFRIAAEAGQNIQASEFSEGTILNISAGIHNYAEKHQL
ncbi:MAG: hypothetical protein RI564_11855, partial [Gracilimonas sp.]|nr:hypothetical protein [Gracilimonas sp.]